MYMHYVKEPEIGTWVALDFKKPFMNNIYREDRTDDPEDGYK